jgi:hypothetical protein
MHLAYFDENKFTTDNPCFWVGGILIPDKKAIDLESTLSQIQYNFFGTSILTKETEFHGKELFHGKGQFKGLPFSERAGVFHDIATFIISNRIPVRMVCIDVPKHRDKYVYPIPEYRLGLMLILERICDYLEEVDDLGVVFGDYEKDELTHSILDFSQFKITGKTPMYFGRPLGRLLDTVYFTHSHHSRFLQVADLLIYMAGRFEHAVVDETAKWHEKQVAEAWKNIKANADIKIQRWP